MASVFLICFFLFLLVTYVFDRLLLIFFQVIILKQTAKNVETLQKKRLNWEYVKRQQQLKENTLKKMRLKNSCSLDGLTCCFFCFISSDWFRRLRIKIKYKMIYELPFSHHSLNKTSILRRRISKMVSRVFVISL